MNEWAKATVACRFCGHRMFLVSFGGGFWGCGWKCINPRCPARPLVERASFDESTMDDATERKT